MNPNGQNGTPGGGLISTTWYWLYHPQFAKTPPIDYFAFAALLMLAGLLWSKVVRQTLEAI